MKLRKTINSKIIKINLFFSLFKMKKNNSNSSFLSSPIPFPNPSPGGGETGESIIPLNIPKKHRPLINEIQLH